MKKYASIKTFTLTDDMLFEKLHDILQFLNTGPDKVMYAYYNGMLDLWLQVYLHKLQEDTILEICSKIMFTVSNISAAEFKCEYKKIIKTLKELKGVSPNVPK